MSALTLATLTVVLAAAFLVAVSVAAELIAHLSRYRHYRRSYPAAERGRVWRHTR